MRRLMPVVFCLLAIASAGPAGGPPAKKGRLDKAATPEEQYRSLLEDYTKHFNDFLKEYRQAKTDVARQKLIQEKLPKAPEYAKRFLKLAEEHPTGPAAADALTWIVRNVRYGPENDKALALLLKNHIRSEQLGSVASMLAYAPSSENERR